METESNATKITRLTLFLLPTILFSSINSYLVIYLRLNPWNGEDFREEIKINEPTGTYASSPLLIDIMGIEGYRINGILLDSSFVLSLDFDWNLNLILFKCELFFFSFWCAWITSIRLKDYADVSPNQHKNAQLAFI